MLGAFLSSYRETDATILASIYRVSLIRHERLVVLRLEYRGACFLPDGLSGGAGVETAGGGCASSRMVRKRYGEARQRGVRSLFFLFLLHYVLARVDTIVLFLKIKHGQHIHQQQTRVAH